MRIHQRPLPPYVALLGVALTAGTLAAMVLAAPAPPAVTLTAGPGVCGTTGVLTGTTTVTCTYTTVGSDTFTVPAGVDSVAIDVVGAQGGRYFIAGDAAHGGSPAGDITGPAGGSGGEAAGTLTSLAAGQILQVDVAGRGVNGTALSRSGGMMNGPSGGQGALGGFGGSNGGVSGAPGDANGANGGTALGNGGNGSGGGGSSDLRLATGGCAALTCDLSTRVLVGAGGGGGGGSGGQGNALGGGGGNGGGATGDDGSATVGGGNHGTSGTGGTQSTGGMGGLEPNRYTNPPPANLNDPRLGGDGVNGTSGAGGAGGAGNLPCTGTQNPPCSGGQNSTTSGGGAGAGGGAGYFGGGGGSGGGGLFGGGGGAGGGGGGGSSFAAAAVTSPTLTNGVNSGTINAGNGQVTITYTAPAADVAVAVGVPASVAHGASITETVTVTNNGPSNAPKVVTAVVVPRGFTVTNPGGGTLLGSSVVSFTDTTLTTGTNVIHTVVLTAPATPQTTELGALSAASPIPDPNPANNTARQTITVS